MNKATSSIPLVTEQNFQELLETELPVLIDFFATWCQPCKAVEPDVEAVAAEFEGKAKVVRVDVDKSPMLAQQLQIRSVPTFAVVHRGRIVAQQAGALRRAQLRTMLEPFLPRSESSLRVAEFLKFAETGRVVAIDTRDRNSFVRAHIPGAIHLPAADVDAQKDKLAATGKIPVLYCRAGDVSKDLAEKLAAEGYPVAFLEGGFLSWEVDGQPIERD